MSALGNKTGVYYTHPDLMPDWYYERNSISPKDITFGSAKKIWWKCSKCSYVWEKRLNERTRLGHKCRACDGRAYSEYNNLGVVYPVLSSEWDSGRNSRTPYETPTKYTKKVWWVCKMCGHRWEASVYNRTVNGTGCPACAGRVVTENNNLTKIYPAVLYFWCYRLNALTPEKFMPKSNKRAWWECSACGYTWQSRISTFTGTPSCPACTGRVVTHRNSLVGLYPEVALEWHPTKNAGVFPEHMSYGSHKKVWWLCSECRYPWEASIKSRTLLNSGCPYCAGQIVRSEDNLSCFDLACEFDCVKNGCGPENYSRGSGKKVWWKCVVCGHRWEAYISNRTTKGHGCPKCALGFISKTSQKWLDSYSIKSDFREYKIYIDDSFIKVDGYDPETNTVYEFLGDFWHGNPEIYDPEDINRVNKKSYGQLYKETLRRFRLLEEVGYKVIYIWEKDFNSIGEL